MPLVPAEANGRHLKTGEEPVDVFDSRWTWQAERLDASPNRLRQHTSGWAAAGTPHHISDVSQTNNKQPGANGPLCLRARLPGTGLQVLTYGLSGTVGPSGVV